MSVRTAVASLLGGVFAVVGHAQSIVVPVYLSDAPSEVMHVNASRLGRPLDLLYDPSSRLLYTLSSDPSQPVNDAIPTTGSLAQIPGSPPREPAGPLHVVRFSVYSRDGKCMGAVAFPDGTLVASVIHRSTDGRISVVTRALGAKGYRIRGFDVQTGSFSARPLAMEVLEYDKRLDAKTRDLIRKQMRLHSLIPGPRIGQHVGDHASLIDYFPVNAQEIGGEVLVWNEQKSSLLFAWDGSIFVKWLTSVSEGTLVDIRPLLEGAGYSPWSTVLTARVSNTRAVLGLEEEKRNGFLPTAVFLKADAAGARIVDRRYGFVARAL